MAFGMSPFPLQFGTRGGVEFSPTDLFGEGDIGAWYVHAADDRLYTTATTTGNTDGTKLVTAPADLVGVRLDKRFPFGDNLVVNSAFETTDGFSVSGGGMSLSVANNVMRFTRGASVNQYMRNTTAIPVVSGEYYIYEIEYVGKSVNTHYLDVRLGATAGQRDYTYVEPITVAGEKKFLFRPNATTLYANLYLRNGTNGDWLEVRNPRVRHIPGYHGLQASDSSRAQYLESSGVGYLDFTGSKSLVTAFGTDLGEDVTIARAIIGEDPSILTGQDIGATFTDTTNSSEVVVINRAITSGETSNLFNHLKKSLGQ